MLGWIPFRVTNLSTVKEYFAKVVSPSEYLSMGLRENVYLITLIVMLLIIITYLLTTYVKPRLEETYLGQVIDISLLSGAVALVIIFLRPVSQFIYFQF